MVRGVWEKREKPSNRYSWSSYSITVGLSVCTDKSIGRKKYENSTSIKVTTSNYRKKNEATLHSPKSVVGNMFSDNDVITVVGTKGKKGTGGTKI